MIDIGLYTFYGCSGLTEIINESVTPQAINLLTFEKTDTSACTLRVPAASVDDYRAAPEWQDFGNIVAIE